MRTKWKIKFDNFWGILHLRLRLLILAEHMTSMTYLNIWPPWPTSTYDLHGLPQHMTSMAYLNIWPPWPTSTYDLHGLPQHMTSMAYLNIWPPWPTSTYDLHGLPQHMTSMAYLNIDTQHSKSFQHHLKVPTLMWMPTSQTALKHLSKLCNCGTFFYRNFPQLRVKTYNPDWDSYSMILQLCVQSRYCFTLSFSNPYVLEIRF